MKSHRFFFQVALAFTALQVGTCATLCDKGYVKQTSNLMQGIMNNLRRFAIFNMGAPEEVL